MNIRFLILIALVSITSIAWSQKYALLDRKMVDPITYTNTVTLEHDYQSLFPIEKNKLNEFVSALEKIVKMLNEKKIPQSLEYNIGSAQFKGLKIPFQSEDRIDITLTANCGSATINMHLVDAKMSNATNAYNIATWIKYIKKETSHKSK